MLDKFIDILSKFFDQLICDHDWELEFKAINTLGKNEYHYICLDCGKKIVLNHLL